MWMILGIIAIITAILSVVWTLQHRDAKWFRFSSLSLTALTLCAFYSQNARLVANNDWSAMMDVVPTMSKMLWALTLMSIIINGFSLMKKR